MVRSVPRPNVFEISGVVARSDRIGKLALPVDPQVVLYSRYKHVRGAAPIGQVNGVPLTKLRALDNLIDRLIRLKSNQPIVRNIDELRPDEVDGLVSTYRRGLHRAIAQQSEITNDVTTYGVLGLSLDLVA